MVLRLYNTLTRTKEDFVPLDPKNVRMYVCGPTVYDFAHIGNARPVIVFDVLFRLLRHLYGETHVTYVRNVTDVDDKINARAAETAAAKGISVEQARAELTAGTEKQYNDDVSALGNLPPTHTPRATAYIPQMVAMIERLVRAGHAYANEGHVLYRVASKADYGKLSRRSLDDMIAGARVDVAPYKEDPMDFVLWKPSTPDLPGWDSPWGRGRPGWHIECSAMSDALLGEMFDIHGGGIDLIFPHHENEIAQSEGAHAGHAPARVWMHNGFLQVEGEKMSKSLGNFVTIRELLNDVWPGDVLRFNMLRTHYREPIDWTKDALKESFEKYFSFLDLVERYSPSAIDAGVIDALSDDLNTPQVMTRLNDLYSSAKAGNIDAGQSLKASLLMLGFIQFERTAGIIISALESDDPSPEAVAFRETFNAVFGQTDPQVEVLEQIASAFPRNYSVERARSILGKQRHGNVGRQVEHVLRALQYAANHVRIGDVERNAKTILALNAAIDARLAARKAKNWKESDRIRDELLAKGIQLKDNPDGTTSWEVKR